MGLPALACNITKEFASLTLGDSRRIDRLKVLCARLAESPGSAVHAACWDWAEAMGAYRLLNSGHCTLTRAREAQGDILLLQDTTELDYTTHKSLSGSGPLAATSRRGFFSHNRLLVTEADGVVLGIEGAQIWARNDVEHGKAQSRKQLPIEEKESMRWLDGYRKACELAAQLPGQAVINVADRESDIYEIYLEHHVHLISKLPVGQCSP